MNTSIPNCFRAFAKYTQITLCHYPHQQSGYVYVAFAWELPRVYKRELRIRKYTQFAPFYIGNPFGLCKYERVLEQFTERFLNGSGEPLYV